MFTIIVIPVRSRIHPDLLNEQAIDFAIEKDGMLVAGVGILWAKRDCGGVDYIDMTYEYGDSTFRMSLTQDLVDRLKQRTSDGRFTLAAVL